MYLLIFSYYYSLFPAAKNKNTVFCRQDLAEETFFHLSPTEIQKPSNFLIIPPWTNTHNGISFYGNESHELAWLNLPKSYFNQLVWSVDVILLLQKCYWKASLPSHVFSGERLLHPSGRVQSGQGRFANSAQLPHVQDVLLPFWWNAGEERSSPQTLDATFARFFTSLRFFDALIQLGVRSELERHPLLSLMRDCGGLWSY